MKNDYDICIIGSGAGGSPIAYELSNAGYNVAVLEKGKNYTEKFFSLISFKFVSCILHYL